MGLYSTMELSMNSFQLALIQAAEVAQKAADAATDAADAVVDAAPKAAEAADAAAAAGGASIAMKLTFAIAVIVLPLVLGQLLASALKLKEFAGRISVCLFALFLSAAPLVWHAAMGTPPEKVIRKGIDLAGGTNMVFQVDRNQTEKEVTDEAMDQMVAAVSRRINVSGTEEVTVRQVGSDRIEVIVPGADRGAVAEIKKRMTKLGSLEFALLANTVDHRNIIDAAMKLPPEEAYYRDATGRVVAVWREIGQKDGETKDISVGRDEAFRDVPDPRDPSKTVRQVLVIQEPENKRITGQYLNRAYATVDQAGRPAVGFVFDQTGSYLFGKLTRANRPRADGSQRRLAILLDNKIHSAPSIEEPIDGNGIIRGDFSQSEIRELVSVLNAGALELPLKPDPINEVTIDPTLGADVQEKGLRAIVVAAIGVVLFMIVYYRFAGLVAVLSLMLNLLLVLSAMILIQATFTLPGIAGLVLTIGMAVDANVLIFERMREEQNRGASLRMAIQNGFGRALTTIIDANVTTLITAAILFMIGTDQVKGFAVTLIIGILMSMFTALYFGRLIFDICERKRWIRSLNMASIIGETKWDFIGKRHIAGAISGLMILGGLSAFIARGSDNYDIDFTGGTMVTFRFEEDHSIDEVRDALVEQFGDDITVERLTLTNAPEGESGRYFRLRTRDRDEAATTTDKQRIKDRVNAAFEGKPAFNLLRITMQYAAPEPIEAEEGADEEATALDPTIGGYRTQLTFSKEVSTVTVLDNFLAALEQVAPGKYPESEALVRVTGTAGSGMTAGVNAVRRFSKATLTTYRTIDRADLEAALKAMQQTMATEPHFDEVNSFASSVAGEMKQSALIAIIVSLIAIVAYIWFRFQRITFGLAAVAALVHDVLVVLGLVAATSFLSGNAIGDLLLFNDFKINLPMIAAFLTIVGYSLNDTIVVFDRIREVRGKNPALTPEMVNISLNQTLSRTLLTSVTTFIVVAILYAIGGEGIHGFAFCLVIGVIVGTYSSIFVASPVLLWLMNRSSAGAAQSTTTSAGKKVAAAR